MKGKKELNRNRYRKYRKRRRRLAWLKSTQEGLEGAEHLLPLPAFEHRALFFTLDTNEFIRKSLTGAFPVRKSVPKLLGLIELEISGTFGLT